MTTKIVFSDGKVQFLKATETSLFNQLKDAQSDKKVNELIQKFAGSFEYCDEADADIDQYTIDLLKKKKSSVKRMHKAFGGRR